MFQEAAQAGGVVRKQLEANANAVGKLAARDQPCPCRTPAPPPQACRPAGRAALFARRREGVRRRHSGRGFSYLDARGPSGSSADATLERIRTLAIPPAWTDVWICPDAHGHLQATGRDARGRKQYRYHPRWREVRDDDKFDRMLEFGEALPRIRRRIERDLAPPGCRARRCWRSVVRLLERR